MDLFVPKVKSEVPIPLVIFVNGGGFSTGNRTSGHNLGKHISANGIACASISYSLYMKGEFRL